MTTWAGRSNWWTATIRTRAIRRGSGWITCNRGPANELTQIGYSQTGTIETRAYNSLGQLRIQGSMNMEYRYSATQNNGQITQQKDWVTGEEVTYTYDSLNRLIRAV